MTSARISLFINTGSGVHHVQAQEPIERAWPTTCCALGRSSAGGGGDFLGTCGSDSFRWAGGDASTASQLHFAVGIRESLRLLGKRRLPRKRLALKFTSNELLAISYFSLLIGLVFNSVSTGSKEFILNSTVDDFYIKPLINHITRLIGLYVSKQSKAIQAFTQKTFFFLLNYLTSTFSPESTIKFQPLDTPFFPVHQVSNLCTDIKDTPSSWPLIPSISQPRLTWTKVTCPYIQYYHILFIPSRKWLVSWGDMSISMLEYRLTKASCHEDKGICYLTRSTLTLGDAQSCSCRVY